MKKIIEELLSKKRYIHSIGVAETAKHFAEKLGIDTEKAYLAGLVHDIAKELKKDEMLKFCEEKNVSLCTVEKLNPSLLHGPVGAEMLKDYGITDQDITNAVRYHTVGREGMSVLEKIIYISDMIEPSRNFQGVDELRTLCEEDFYKGYAEGLRYSMIFNLKKGNLIHEGTLRAWNDLLIGGMKIDF